MRYAIYAALLLWALLLSASLCFSQLRAASLRLDPFQALGSGSGEPLAACYSMSVFAFAFAFDEPSVGHLRIGAMRFSRSSGASLALALPALSRASSEVGLCRLACRMGRGRGYGVVQCLERPERLGHALAETARIVKALLVDSSPGACEMADWKEGDSGSVRASA